MTLRLPRHKTRIVCTIGPASDKIGVLVRMIRAGMNVARLNLAHGTTDDHARTIADLRRASEQAGQPVAILADLPGPKLRIGPIRPDPLRLHHGRPFALTTELVTGDTDRVSVLDFPALPHAVRRGESVFLNDGFIELKVMETSEREVQCKVAVGGELRSHKGLNIPRMHVSLPAFSERDQALLAFACEQGVEAISISFVETAGDIERVRREAESLGAAPYLIAKIERSLALPNLEAILAAADGIMVARGDLGVETPIEAIALTQKTLIRKANLAGKPVITATQMLESMVDHSRPTRAEATDVANAVLDGTDAVMLSEESALGAYPVEAVTMLGRIAHRAEAARRELVPCALEDDLRYRGVQDVIALNVVTAVEHLKAPYVITPTETGSTARRISRFHLPAWIIALSAHHHTCQRLLFSYGVYPVHVANDARDWQQIAREWLRSQGLDGSPLVLTQGPSRGHPGNTNRMEILT